MGYVQEKPQESREKLSDFKTKPEIYLVFLQKPRITYLKLVLRNLKIIKRMSF